MTASPSASAVIEQEGPNGERLFAAVDPSCRYIAPKVSSSRLGALLAPFPDEVAALAAIKAAGGEA